jgi:FkbM family methyltransferase
MFGKLPELSEKSYQAYNEGGLPLLKKRISLYIGQKLLFNPHIPPILLIYKTKLVSFGYRDKYLYNDPISTAPKVVPKPSDTVVEAGVHRGLDTAMFAKLANQVVGFEPSPRNYTVAKDNLSEFKNIRILNEGLWNEQSELDIQYGTSDSDDGFLSPDTETVKSGDKVPVNTLEAYVERLDIDNIDYLKVEAEGAEPEIIEGIGELRPEKIVVNADEERNGRSPIRQIMKSLHSKGYNLVAVSKGSILFFVLNKDYGYSFRNEFR